MLLEVDTEQLKAAVEGTHSCSAQVRATHEISEVFNRNPVWQGIVHEFEVDNHDTDAYYIWSSSP